MIDGYCTGLGLLASYFGPQMLFLGYSMVVWLNCTTDHPRVTAGLLVDYWLTRNSLFGPQNWRTDYSIVVGLLVELGLQKTLISAQRPCSHSLSASTTAVKSTLTSKEDITAQWVKSLESQHPASPTLTETAALFSRMINIFELNFATVFKRLHGKDQTKLDSSLYCQSSWLSPNNNFRIEWDQEKPLATIFDL